jgi:hypothetical protein
MELRILRVLTSPWPTGRAGPAEARIGHDRHLDHAGRCGRGGQSPGEVHLRPQASDKRGRSKDVEPAGTFKGDRSRLGRETSNDLAADSRNDSG